MRTISSYKEVCAKHLDSMLVTVRIPDTKMFALSNY